MNILITGCRGQLGSELRQLQGAHPGHRFINTDVGELDVTDPEAIGSFLDAHGVDGIVNCAAYTAVDRAESDRGPCEALNSKAPAHLAVAIQRRGGWIVHVSTDYVFDGLKCEPYLETDPPCPRSVYGSTKLAGEAAVLGCCSRAMVVRTSWLYSAFGNNFVKTMVRLGRERDSLGVVFDQVGSPTYARDLARAIMVAVEGGVVRGVFHFSNEGVCSWYDFAKAVHAMAGIASCRLRPIRTSEYPTPAPRPPYSVLDKAKVKEALGIEIPHWRDSLLECMSQLGM